MLSAGSVTQGFATAQPQVVTVATRAQRRAFVELPYTLYAGHPHWVPPLRRDEYRRLDPSHNPFFEHADMQRWLAMEGERVVGRIAGIVDHLHDEKYRERVAFFGFFEARTEAAARVLVEAVAAWGRARGATLLRGPVNPSMNESAGLLIDAFDADPYVLMPYNPPAYAGYLEATGLRKVKDLWAWDIDLRDPQLHRITRLADRVRQRHGIVVRPIDLSRFDRELETLQGLYRTAWQENWGFVAPTDAEIRQLAVDLKPVLDPELLLFAEMHGRVVGCSVGIPDVNQVLRQMNGRLLPFGLWHFLRRRRTVTRGRILLMGVVPEARRIGLYPLLIAECHRRGVGRGYVRAELSWTLEDNDAVNAGIEAAGGRRYKTYRMYERAIG